MAESSRRNWLRTNGLIIGLVAAAWWLYSGISWGSGQELDFVEALLHTALPGLIFLVSVALAWKWKAAGGVLLVVEGLFVTIAGPVTYKHCPQMTIVLLLLTGSLPLLASGLLLILSWRKGLAGGPPSQGDSRQD